MKKKKYIIILTSIFSILLTVSILFNVKNILDNKKFLFDKKETCIKYKDEVLKKYPKSDIHNTDIVEIFYSPSENTCIGYIRDEIGFSSNSILYDILTDRELINYMTKIYSEPDATNEEKISNLNLSIEEQKSFHNWYTKYKK